ncbi:cobalamin-binding protein [Pigmentiphaga soli]|uniref:Cobalamin-binding protein n=1 Tax=Pigmentiphaga soli TaxID=1007095 RepID=A0ABP8HNV3_9BURK
MQLHGPVQRVVSLAPHLTEMLFAAGAGARVVGVDQHSDYPAAARALPRVGDGLRIDVERILSVKPDLVVLWSYGALPAASQKQPLQQLQDMGVAVYYSHPAQLSDIPDEIGRFGRIMGTAGAADAAADRLRHKLQDLAFRYAAQRPVRVFYQIGGNPAYTVNGRSMISHALGICGGVNVFAALRPTSPIVGTENVLVANPQAIIAGGSDAQSRNRLAAWKKYAPGLAAAALGNLWTVDADRMHRPGPRMIEETGQLCEYLDQARQRAYADSAPAEPR